MKVLCYITIFVLTRFTATSQQVIKPVCISRGDSTQKQIFLIFSGDEYGDGAEFIRKTLKQHRVTSSFFLTGNFYRSPKFAKIIRQLREDGHYLGSHSDRHLLYCDWNKRDSLLVTRKEFTMDMENSYRELLRFNILRDSAKYFLPPYEWFNDSIVRWTFESGLQLVNFTSGTRSTADYTFPEMGKRYVDSKTIFHSIINAESNNVSGLNGYILLIHIGTDPKRRDKFYFRLPRLIIELKARGYRFEKIDQL